MITDQGLKEVLEGQIIIDLAIRGITPSQIQDFLESKGFKHIGLDSNGWQHDFWNYFEKDGVRIVHCGCWFWEESLLRHVDARKDNTRLV